MAVLYMSDLTTYKDALAFITGVNACVNRSHDIGVIIADVDDMLQRYMSINGACLYLPDDDGRPRLIWSRGFTSQFVAEPEVQMPRDFSRSAGMAVAQKAVVFVEWSDQHPPGSFADLLAKEGMREPVWVALTAHGRVLGVLALTRRRNNAAYDEEVMRPLLEFLGRELGMACASSVTDSEFHTKLQELEAKWRCVHDEAPVMYLAVDAGGLVVNCNDAIFSCLGYGVEDVVGEHISHLLPSYNEKLLAAIEGQASQRVQFEDTVRDKSGRLREVTALWRPIADPSGAEAGAYVIVEDITERNTLESENLCKSLLVENSVDGMFVRDLGTGMIVYANEPAWKTRGYTKEEFFALRPEDLTASDHVPILRDLHQQFLRDGGITMAIPQVRKDGSIMHAEITTKLLEHRGRRLVIVVVHDVTERNWLQNELHQSHKLESLGRLAAGIAHDFNNMLAGILGHASMMKSTLGVGDPLSESVDVIERTASQAAKLVSQLVVFAKGGKPKLQPVNPNQIVRDVAGLLAPSLNDNIKVVLKLDPDLPFVEADETQITQCLLNLCLNARDAMPDGGVLTIKTRRTDIDVAVAAAHLGHIPTGKHAGIRIQDTGTGMDEDTQKRVFEPFFTTKAGSGGAGFGLAITYGIVKSHGGHIDVKSTKGQGSVFTIALPAISAAGPPERKNEAELPQGPRGAVLVVEDDETVRDFLRIALSRAGYSAILAEDGASAVQIMERRKSEVALVILDMVMPGMDGRETWEKLRAIRPDLRALVSSGYSDDDSVIEGVMGYLQKPYRLRELLEAVKSSLLPQE